MKKREGNVLKKFDAKPRTAVFLALLALLFSFAALAEEAAGDGFYDLNPLVSVKEEENAVLFLERSYYSGEQIYKGTTRRPLNGACALHCGAVLISNLRDETVSGQQVAKANNRDIKNEKRWTPFVSWGKVASAFGVDLHTANIAQYGDNLKRRGVRDDERRAMKRARIVEVYRSSGQNGGMMVHFNSSGRLNGSGTHRHAVVLVGYIERGGEIVDLLVNDSSVAAPAGGCVRRSEASPPLSIIGARKLKKAEDKGEDIAMMLMDYAVSCRWATLDDKQ